MRLGDRTSEVSYSKTLVIFGDVYYRLKQGDGTESSTNESDAWVAKYDIDGDLIWNKQLDSESFDASYSVAVDNAGNIYAAGATQGNLEGNNAGDYDAWVAKYDSNGELVWKRQWGTPLTDLSIGVATDDAGNVYITGETDGSLEGSNNGGIDTWLAHYDTDGNLIKVEQFGSADDDKVKDITIDGAGNVYLIGDTKGSLSETNAEGIDTWVAKYRKVNDTPPINLVGTPNNDLLEGGAGDDTIFGKGGNDTLIGGAGADTLDGGNGNDTYFVDNAFDTIVENSSNGNDTVYSEVDFSIAEFGRVENLILTDNAIYGIGNSRDNVITGNSLDNILSDDEGEDTLDGGLGNDTLIGGTEDDTYIIDSLEDTIIENESEGFDIVEASIDYSIENIAHVEHLILTGNAIIGTGNSLDNYIDGNALDNVLNGLEGDDDILGLEGNDTLDGGTGDDTLRGGKGDDTYIIDSTSDTIIEESGNDTVKASINYSIASLNKIDNLTLTGDAISGTGNSDGNEIKGNALDNILDGVEGSDALYGGAGNDSLIGGTGRDTLNGGAGDDTLLGGEDKDTLSGGAGNNTLIGGTEDDTYIVDSLNNIIIENTSSGFDIVEASVDYSIDGFDNVEHLILTGSAVTGTGNSLDNYVDGNALDNVLNDQEGDDDIWGLLGNDILNGGTGDDTLTGHEGDDTLIGGMGDDELIGSAGADIFVFNNPNEGIDEITDFSVTDDTIHISAAGFGGGLIAGDTISEDQILIGSSSAADSATQRFIYKTNSGGLYFDADGNQSGFDAVRIATLILEPTISASDIFVTL